MTGIVVAGLCKKDDQGKPQYSANDLVELYQRYGAYIFKSSFLGDQYSLGFTAQNTHVKTMNQYWRIILVTIF